MGKKGRSPAEVQRSLVHQVQSIAAHTRGISDELTLMSQNMRDGLESSTDPTADLLAAAGQLSSSTLKASTNLSDCLDDLVKMGEAMAPVLGASPEAAPALLLNFFSTFVTQMGAFYAEMTTGWERGSQSVSRGKSTFFRESPGAGTALAARTADVSSEISPVAAPAATTPVNGEADEAAAVKAGRRKKHDALEATADDGLAGQHGLAGDDTASTEPAAHTGKKGGKKKAAAAASVPEDATPIALSSALDNTDTPTDSRSSRNGPEDSMAALAAAVESGAQTAATRRSAKNVATTAVPGSVAEPELTPEELSALARSEPPYLLLTSTLEAALGAVVMASRPNVFSNLSSFTYDEPVSTYYIRLARPWSLAYFVYCNYVCGSEETQADFLCDVLETDCAEVDPFVSPAGEVLVDDPEDLSSLPACAWGIGSSEDNERRLYTMYALIKQPPRVGPTVIIQDSLNMDGVRDEVLHMVTLVDGAPEYARVTCMVYSEVRSAETPNQKQAAIIGFSRSGFHTAGFREVPESEVNAAQSRVKRRKQSAADARMALFGTQKRDATTAFQPPVQLASLDQPAGDAGISLGGVGRAAMQGGIEVLKAPFTAGRAVGGALLDVTGVTGAMRSNMESNFRKSFPNLASETLVDSFNCAWVEKSLPKQGHLFITPHWLCFQCTMVNAHFSMEYDEIKDIVKSKSIKMFENAIEVKTHLNDSIFLTSFLQRDQAYTALMSQWLKQ